MYKVQCDEKYLYSAKCTFQFVIVQNSTTISRLLYPIEVHSLSIRILLAEIVQTFRLKLFDRNVIHKHRSEEQ